MDRKIMNRLPVADALQGEELVYGTDKNGVPQYIPVRLIKEVTLEAEDAAQAASGNATVAETARVKVEQLVPLLISIKAEIQGMLDESRNVLSQTTNQKARASATALGVSVERERIEKVAEEVRLNAFAAQLAKEYADQAAASASSKEAFELLTVDFDSRPEQTQYQVPPGWYAILTIVDGRLRRRGPNKDWTSSYTGTIEIVELAVAPADETWVSIICGRKH